MKEYNLRKEREKSREDEQAYEKTAAQKHVVQREYSLTKIFIAVGILIVAAAVGAWYLFFNDAEKVEKKLDSSAQLAAVAEKHKTAVGLVIVTIELKNGKKFTEPFGTAWAYDETHFATNAHVANGIKNVPRQMISKLAIAIFSEEAKEKNYKNPEEYLKKVGEKRLQEIHQLVLKQVNDVRADILINGEKNRSYTITHVQIHKNYGTVGSNFIPDVAVLTIDGKHDNYFKLADQSTLNDLKSGEAIAYLGFPMENLANDNVNTDNPVASMQSGIIVAVTDFEMKDAGVDGNYLLRHNLPSTGGASGSPIFNQNGEVVGLLFAGNVIGQISNGKETRAPSAAMINFAVRVDLLKGMGEAVPVKEFIK